MLKKVCNRRSNIFFKNRSWCTSVANGSMSVKRTNKMIIEAHFAHINRYISIRYDTIAEFNVDSKAEYSAFSGYVAHVARKRN